MYKALLVDDELVDLEWLHKRMNWKDQHIEIVNAVNSGFAALEIIKNQSIDILISDIRMPVMSGLELAAKAKELNPSLKIIFISGHEEFEYAKKAILLKATGYVLKPIENLELLETLNTVKRTIQEEKELENQKNQIHEAMPVVKSEAIHQWLEGQRQVDESTLYEYFPITDNQSLMVALVEVDDVQWKLNHYTPEARENMLNHLFDAVKSAGGIMVSIRVNKYQMIMICSLDKCCDFQALIHQIKQETNLTITIGLGDYRQGYSGLKESYQKAKELLNYKMFLGKNRMISEDSARGPVGNDVSHLEDRMERLFLSVTNYNLVGVDDELKELFYFIKQLDTKISVYNFTLYLISKLDNLLSSIQENLFEILGWKYENLDVIYHFETIDDIQSWLRRKLFELSELFMIKHEKQNRRMVDQIIEYVTDQLENKITLRQVADVFSFSPNYLGFMFKEETGENFSDFLIRTRMEKASKYLHDPQMRIYEITEKVGYKNTLYFNRQFKEFFGMTPTEFRKKRKV